MDRNNKLIAKMSRDARRNTTRMSRTVENNFRRMGTSAVSFGRTFATGLAGGLVAGALGVFTTNLAQAVRGIASIGDAAQRAGLAVDTFQEWSFVAQQNRIGIDQLVDGFKELNLRADEFIVTGAGPAAEAIARLGFDAVSLARDLEDPSELMLEILGRMEDLDRAGQIRVADELFGGSAGERFVELLDQGERGLRNTIALAHDVGAVMEQEMIQRATILDQKFGELTTRLRTFLQAAAVGLFAGGVETPVDTLERMFGTLDRARATLGDSLFDELISQAGELDDVASAALGGIATGADDVHAATLRAASGMADVTGQLSDLGRVQDMLSFDAVIADMEQLVADMRAGRIGTEEFDRELQNAITHAVQALSSINDIDGIDVSGAVTQLSGLAGMLRLMRGEAQALRSELPGDEFGMTTGTPLDASGPIMPPTAQAPRTSIRPRAAPLGDGRGAPPVSGGGGSAEGYAAAVEDIQARTRALELEAAALVAVAVGGREYGDAVEYARTRAQLMNEALTEGRAITPELQAEIDALAASYVAAGQSAEDAADSMERVREDAERGADAIGSIFEGLAQGGDAARTAFSRLLQQLASTHFQRLLSVMGGGGGGILSAIGASLGGKRASGGPVQAGVPYLVNENTANSEIMVPSRSGGVLNVAQAKDALRGQSAGQSATYNIDARGAQIGVAEQIEQAIKRAQPGIVKKSVQATYAASREVRFT